MLNSVRQKRVLMIFYIKTTDEQAALITHLQLQVDAQGDYSRRRNIIIDGLNGASETTEQSHAKVEKLLKDKLELPDIKIDTAHRISKKDSSKTGPRTLIVRLCKDDNRLKIMKNSKKLKNTGIYINEDYSDGTMKVRQSKQQQLKEAREGGLHERSKSCHKE